MKSQAKFAAVFLFGFALAGCASTEVIQTSDLPREHGRSRVEEQAGQKPLQCVPYAREHSQVKIYGDAYTWWDKAAGRYQRGQMPEAGTVMVLHDYAGDTRAHVAVVRRIVSTREIRVDHANWLDDGSIYVNDPVVDVSQENDWSAVRVWNIKTGGWGGKVYPVQGFIGTGTADARIARADPSPDMDNGATAETGQTP